MHDETNQSANAVDTTPAYARKTKLGESTQYPNHYDPALLQRIARSDYRATIEQSAHAHGVDRWICYELSWLDSNGKPQVSILDLEVSSSSPNIVESKSLKLYLNSINTAVFESSDKLLATLSQDIGKCLACDPKLSLQAVASVFDDTKTFANSADTLLIDGLDVPCSSFQRDRSLLSLSKGLASDQTLVSHLFRSHCPATNQPDWASVFIRYSGPTIDQKALLQYLVSYREHRGFHEQCIEQIYADLMQLADFEALTVEGRFTRRGGIEINPYRSSEQNIAFNTRLNRQ